MVMKIKKLYKSKSHKIGLPPGSLVYLGKQEELSSQVSLFDYDEYSLVEKSGLTVDELSQIKKNGRVHWVNLDGVNDVETLSEIGKLYNLHSLTLEDVLNTDQRPKLDDQDSYLYLVVKMLEYDEKSGIVRHEQLSLILGDHFVLSMQERPGDTFDAIRNRLRQSKGKTRKQGADFLFYALLDTIVDSYYLILEKLGERAEAIEETLLLNPNEDCLRELYHLKKEILTVKKSIWPLREVIWSLLQDDYDLIKEETKIFLRDIYDHVIQIMESVESYRDMLGNILDLYQNMVSNRMNSVMKILTMISTIFIPLTFIAGVYGMNFQYMPELEWRYGYFGVMGLMAVMSIGMVLFFKQKKWF